MSGLNNSRTWLAKSPGCASSGEACWDRSGCASSAACRDRRASSGRQSVGTHELTPDRRTPAGVELFPNLTFASPAREQRTPCETCPTRWWARSVSRESMLLGLDWRCRLRCHGGRSTPVERREGNAIYRSEIVQQQEITPHLWCVCSSSMVHYTPRSCACPPPSFHFSATTRRSLH